MIQVANHTALLVFSRTTAEEVLYKQFVTGAAKQNYKVIDALIQRSRKLACQSGLSSFVFTENEQNGTSFGEKLLACVQTVFEKGFQKIIIIGNDCPQLTSLHIQQATLQLERYDQVLSPTKKGGASLIGITKVSFNSEAFLNVRWQSSFAYHDLENLFSSSLFLLPLLDDLNHASDLHKQLIHLSTIDSLRIYLVSILASITKYPIKIDLQLRACNPRFLFSLKAPPYLFP